MVDIPDAETSELEAPEDVSGWLCPITQSLLLIVMQSSSYMSDPDAIYLHLEAARARQAVMRARVHLATCELSEHMCRTRLDRLKVEHFEKALATVNSNVGQWCDNIRRSGRPLHSYSLMLRRTPPHRQLDLAPCKAYTFCSLWICANYKVQTKTLIDAPSLMTRSFL